jgi:hypothetical protein
MTPWNTSLFLEARVTQLAEEFPLSHGILKFIMLFTGPLNPTLISMQPHKLFPSKINIQAHSQNRGKRLLASCLPVFSSLRN